jgi:predicted metal-dependent phosphoesterase TrpH
MKYKVILWQAGMGLLLANTLWASEPVTRARSPIHIPDVPGYVTLKCDFHMHTVFSDGLVWPTVRVEEAWREGLDAISLTDHVEYQPHSADVSTNRNRSYELARGTGADLSTIVIRGAEITRKMPPGHLNAIFITNANELSTTEWLDAAKAARQQGAFIFWNHPGWDAQTTNGLVVWYPAHTQLLEQDLLQGIEVVNGRDYYPEAHRWAIEKKLAMLCNSDIHAPLNLDYHVHAGDHRPTTLVFAKARTPEAIQEALFARRTAAYSGHQLVGDEQFLRSIFENSVRFETNRVNLKGKQRVLVQIANLSDIQFELERSADLPEITLPKTLVLPPQKTVLLDIRGKTTTAQGAKTLALPFQVKNLLIAPGVSMVAKWTLEVNFTPQATK